MKREPNERARDYLARVPGAISGQAGHDATFHAACVLVNGFALSAGEALPLLMEWNASCQPPWSEAELRHKLASAEKAHHRKARGHLLSRGTHPAPIRPPIPPPPIDDSMKADLRKSWPDMETPRWHLHDFLMLELAALRHVSIEGVRLMAERGLLCFAGWKGKTAFIVTDGERVNAQARRMDGEKWGAINVKAQTLPGSKAAWPVGARESLVLSAVRLCDHDPDNPCCARDCRTEVQRFPVVLFCEGGPDLLAAHHFIQAHGREADTAAVAMLGAGNAIPPEALPLFAGKRIRIMAHTDEAGRAAAQKWAEQLASVGADVDAADFAGLFMADGSPVKDLNDCTRLRLEDQPQLEDLIPR